MALTTFQDLSRRKYHDIAKRKLAGGVVAAVPFTLDDFRTWLTSVSIDGKGEAWRCSYCLQVLALSDVQCDHMDPLSRGGEQSVDNLTPSDRACNQRKGELTAVEFTAVKALLAQLGYAAEKYVLESLSLAGMARRMQAERFRAKKTTAGAGRVRFR